MLATYLIGLREGLEAALIVSILAAYLVRTDRSQALRWIWAGVAAAVAVSVTLALVLNATSASMSATTEQLFAGVMSLLAVGLVTWMVFWMKTASRTIAGDLRQHLDRAFTMGIGAIAAVSFVSVVREGLETAVFFVTLTGSTGETGLQPLVGLLAGLGSAAAVGWLLYRGAIRVNLSQFFRYTGILLILVAAGVLAYGIHELQEVGILPGEELLAFDVSHVVAKDSWLGSVARGLVGFRPAMSVLEVVAWLTYVSTTLLLFLRPPRTTGVPERTTQSVA